MPLHFSLQVLVSQLKLEYLKLKEASISKT